MFVTFLVSVILGSGIKHYLDDQLSYILTPSLASVYAYVCSVILGSEIKYYLDDQLSYILTPSLACLIMFVLLF